MKIQTTEAVRRFNAQVELADIVLSKLYAANSAYSRHVDCESPRGLYPQLISSGHSGLAAELRKASEAIGYSWTDADPGQTPQIPPASMTTKGCDHNNMILTDTAKPLGKFVWKCADCGYEGATDREQLRNVIERLLNAYAWGRKSQQVENLHAAVRSAMEAIGEL